MTQVRIFPGFEALPAAYQPLFDAASRRAGFFLSLPWFRTLAAHGLPGDQQLRIYTLESDDGRATAALPMRFTAPPDKRGGARILQAAASYYASLFDAVLGNEAADAAAGADSLHALASAIRRDSYRWDLVDLHPLAYPTPQFTATLNAFRRAGMAAHPYFCFGNWYLPVRQRSFAEYFAALPSRLQHTVQRKAGQLQRERRLRLEIVSTAADLERGLAAYAQVYANSWKPPEPFPDFVPGWLAASAAQGWLRLGLAYVDGQPAAAQIWLVQHKTASIYKLAYDQRYAKLSVGSILTAHMMRQVIDEERVDEVDYLTGDDGYKQDWMSHRRERWGIVAFNLRSWRGLSALGRHLAGRALRGLRSPRHGVRP